MGKNFDRIATVSIDIAPPLVSSTSFDDLLIFGPAPAKKAKTGSNGPAVGVYAGLEEIKAAGYATEGKNADIVGVAARIAFSQKPQPSKIYVAAFEDGATIEEALSKLLGTVGWYVICPVGLSEEQLNAVMEWTEAQKKLCAYAAFKPAASKQSSYYRSFGIYCKETSDQEEDAVPAANKCAGVAWAAKCLFYHAGQATWAFKSLAGIAPSALTSTEMEELENSNISCFLTIGSKNITCGGKTLAGEWIDLIRFRDWLESDMQERVANLFITNPKIPYTDNGIALVQNQMIAALKSGIYWGGISQNEYDSDGNLVPAFVTSVPQSANLSSAQKASRKLLDCTFTARIAGAIHMTEINGSLSYEL